MKEIITDDGSLTFLNEEIQETYHSTSGAVDESLRKFVEPSGMKELCLKGSVKILDICFGIGYNTCAALDFILALNPDCKISVTCIEKDKEILSKIKGIDAPFRNYPVINELARNLAYEKGNVSIRMVIGDALEEVKKLDQEFDVVFHDPFSPAKCPALWTKELFSDIWRVMKNGGRLTTYSCAGAVRRNLKEAGFDVMDGPCVGRRAPSTIAVKRDKL